MEPSSSDSSHRKPKWKNHVFLSFRGVDTYNGFTDHLYAALKENGVLTFKDDEELERGGVISQQLVKTIHESLFAIVILSPNYPSSSWCLDALQEILESRRIFGGQAFPVFYGVDPSQVRYQKGSFAEAFIKHEKKFGKDSIKIQKWRKALSEVANLSGWDSKNWQETILIEQIVHKLCMKLSPFLPSHNDELVGIDSRMEEIYSLLRLNEMNDVRFIGIWGTGGAGKTTLAKVIYNRINNQFDGSCFLQDVREFSERESLVELQRKLLSSLKVQGIEINDLYDGMMTIRNTLCNKRILLILDDVNDIKQLENLVGDQKWFGQGSRVIVTTRNKHLMTTYRHLAFVIYEVKLLNSDESLQLFLKKSFIGDQPKEEFFELSKLMVQYAGGVPLALKVFGSFLCGRSKAEWRDAMNMMKQDPQDNILKTIRLSYDGLENSYKAIFLDIACFFKGWDRNRVTHILQICDHNATIGIEVLIEKSLLTYDGQSLGMHDLIQEMGKYIVLLESPNDVCGRSRLWSIKDIHHVLAKNKENEVIQGIVLNSFESYEGHWNLEAISKICNLKLLILRTRLHCFNSLNYLSNALRVLEWTEYPLESLPPTIQLNNLVDLKLHHSRIKQLWTGIKCFQELKFIDLSHSKYLFQTPNVFGVPCLETMVLKGCTNLLEVHQSTGHHKKLAILSLEGCLNLKILPKKLEMNSLKIFILSGCSKIKKLPQFGDNMESLSMLDVKDCKNLLCLPNSIHNLKSLKILNISGCSKFSKIPNNLNEIEALEELDVSGTAIRAVPSFIVHLKNLQKLSFRGCKGLSSNYWDLTCPFGWFHKFQRHQNPMGLMFPSISPSISQMLRDGSIFDNHGNLSSLLKINLCGNNFVDLPIHCIVSLSKLDDLDGSYCAKLPSLLALPPSLTSLGTWGCTSMDFVSYSQQLLSDLFASESPSSKICLDKPLSDATISKPPAEESSLPACNLEMIGHLEGSRLKESEVEKFDQGEFQDKVEEISAVPGNITDDDDYLYPLVSHCFLFLSSYQFTRDELVTLWIAEELLQSDHFDRVLDVAYAKFDSLVSQEIIVPSKAYQFQNHFYHTVEKLLYEVNESKVPSFGDSLTVDGYQRVTVGDLNNILESEKVLHLSLLCEKIDEMTLKSMKRFKHLQTLFLVPNYGLSIKHVPHPLFLILNNLRSLNLSGSLVSELPSSVGCLKSLRYFDLSRTPIRKLPNSIENLQNLQIIKLWDCLNLFELPKGMGKLTNLRHLGLDVIGQLMCMPPGMGNLTKLRSLSAFIVGRNEGCQIGELKSTRNLTGAFCISKLENVRDYEEAKTADLIDKKFINKLELCWTNVRVCDFVEEEKILEQLQPQLGLQELRILCYGGSKLPSWIDNPSYASLLDITLYNFKNCRHLPAFGRLPSLKFLHLKEMNELKRIDHQFYGNGEHDCVFPKLEKLTIQRMPKLEEWTGIKDGDLPSLYKLKVENIPKLMSLPLLSCLCSLKYLELSYCPNIVSLPSGQMASSLEHLLIKDCPELSKRCSGSESQDWIKIAHVPNITIDDEEINSNLRSTPCPVAVSADDTILFHDGPNGGGHFTSS